MANIPRQKRCSCGRCAALGRSHGAQRPGRHGAAHDVGAAVSTHLGTDSLPVDLNAETGFPPAKALAECEFTKQHPNVTFDIARTSSRPS